MRTPYLSWALARPPLKYDLAASDIPSCLPKGAPAHFHKPEQEIQAAASLPQLVSARYQVPINNVAIMPGTAAANHLVMAALLNPGDHVVIEHPVYDPLPNLAKYFGADISFVARHFEDSYALDTEALRKACTPRTRLIVLTNLYNPAGVRLSNSIIESVAELAEDIGAHVLIDEVYLEWLYNDSRVNNIRAAAAYSPRCVTTSSLTKAFGLGPLHIGWILAEPGLIERINDIAPLVGTFPSRPSAAIAAHVLKNSFDLISERRSIVDRNRELVHQWVLDTTGAEWCKPDAGTTAFVRVDGINPDTLLERLMSDYDAAIVPGRFFGAPEYFRIGYGNNTDIVAEGLKRVSAALK